MLFNSYIFIFFFLPITFAGYWLLSRWRHPRQGWLLCMSYLFYGYWSFNYLPLIWLSTAIDFVAGRQIERSDTMQHKQRWLMLSLLANLGTLGIFKYFDFFATSINAVAGEGLAPLLNVALPVGISFYTFQSMSYTIDIYRGKVAATNNPLQFALYVTLFPQLIAGPIVRYSDIAETLQQRHVPFSLASIQDGVFFFTVGLVKKLLIADTIAQTIDPMLANYESLDLWGAWIVALGYTYQLYFDFSGYTDMAIGLGRLFGFSFPQNFNAPYLSRNISDFWRRWHITLSNWLRDYLFISLGGSRGKVMFVLRNLMLTMLLGGLWHGAAWTFVIWGAYHGILLSLFHAYRLAEMPRWHDALARFGTFLAVLVGWVMFRAESVSMAVSIYESMLGLNGIGTLDAWNLSAFFGWIMVYSAIYTNLDLETWNLPTPRRAVPFAITALILALTITLISVTPSPFLYFQF